MIAFLQSTGHPGIADDAEPSSTPLVLGSREDCPIPGRFVDDPYLMLVEAAREGGNPLVVDGSYLGDVVADAYLEALAAAAPTAKLIVVGDADVAPPGIARADSVAQALSGLLQ